MGLFSIKRSKTLPSMVASSRESVSKACSVTKGEREEHLNRAGIVDQDRRTRTDVELCRQHHIRCTTPLEKFFARAALAQRLVQRRPHGRQGSRGHQSFW